MAARISVRLDSRGIGQVLRSSEMATAVNAAAERVAASSRSSARGATVAVEPYRTDRAAAAVVIRDRRGVGLQAKHGVLTRGASAAGLEVRTRR